MPPSPNPSWKPGAKISTPFTDWVTIDPATLKIPDLYRLLVDAIVPRPIAFVTSISASGAINLAPFSYFNGVSSNPPTLVFSVTYKPDGTKKDTLRNIEETKEFVVNSVAKWMVEPMHQCSAEYPYGVNELEKVGLTSISSSKVKVPRVKESPIQLECELFKTVEIGAAAPGAATLVIGKILCLHISTDAYQDGRILIDKIAPIARLGGTSYGQVSGVFDIPRPKL